MINIANNQRITFFPTKEAAEAIAKVNQEADDDWFYVVTHYSKGWVIEIRGEGRLIGTL